MIKTVNAIITFEVIASYKKKKPKKERKNTYDLRMWAICHLISLDLDDELEVKLICHFEIWQYILCERDSVKILAIRDYLWWILECVSKNEYLIHLICTFNLLTHWD